jgi:aminoglycoside 6-adenylyltransferase
MNQDSVLGQVLDWARGETNVRAMVLTGSVARDRSDEQSDLDIELYVHDPSSLLDHDEWYTQFGEVLVVEELENPGWHPTRLVYYADGKIDFMVASADVLLEGVTHEHPFQVLLDKDDAAERIRLAPTHGEPPTSADYTRCVNWFYAAVITWAKYLARSEPWAAKSRDWDSKGELLTMIEWDHKARYGWDDDTQFGGTHLREWVDADILAAVTDCWSDFSPEDSAAALHASLDLFDMLSGRTAVALGIAPFDAAAVRRRVDDLLSGM